MDRKYCIYSCIYFSAVLLKRLHCYIQNKTPKYSVSKDINNSRSDRAREIESAKKGAEEESELTTRIDSSSHVTNTYTKQSCCFFFFSQIYRYTYICVCIYVYNFKQSNYFWCLIDKYRHLYRYYFNCIQELRVSRVDLIESMLWDT